jgi:translation initiation factor 4A
MSEENQPLDNVADEEITTNWDECTPTFDSMDLKEELLRGIYAYGFERPSAIQQVLSPMKFDCSRLSSFSTLESY